MLRGGGRLPEVRVAIRRIPPVDPALASRKQLPSAGAFMDQGALVLRKKALHLEEHLFCGACPQTLMLEEDLTPPTSQISYQYHLIDITAGRPLRGLNHHDLIGAVGGEIA